MLLISNFFKDKALHKCNYDHIRYKMNHRQQLRMKRNSYWYLIRNLFFQYFTIFIFYGSWNLDFKVHVHSWIISILHSLQGLWLTIDWTVITTIARQNKWTQIIKNHKSCTQQTQNLTKYLIWLQQNKNSDQTKWK